jgi:hypothetical protein
MKRHEPGAVRQAMDVGDESVQVQERSPTTPPEQLDLVTVERQCVRL